ncbi:MAG: hypothetical protein JEY94_00055 [Melioribacteraceae bacterium]|nr:hypothetical protein [Melioribacteraceae bacterium]
MISKLLYLEFLIPLKDYLVTLKLKEIIYEWMIPIGISVYSYYCFFPCLSKQNFLDFNGYVINALAILIGFSITCITILSTSNNENIVWLKKKESERKIGNKNISLYQLIFITFSFVLFMEVFTLLFNLIYFLVFSSNLSLGSENELFALNTTLVLNIVFLNIRNISNFYFIHWNDNL